MAERLDDLAAAFRAPAYATVQQVHDYWRARCAPDGGPPRRDDLDPLLDIPQAAPNLTLLDVERDAAGRPVDYFFRLVGTRIVAFEGDCTGRRLSEILVDRDLYADAWAQYADATAGRLWIRVETLAWQDRGHLTYSSLFLPLRREGEAVEMLLGVHVDEGVEDGRPPIAL